MTIIDAGGVVFSEIAVLHSFERAYRKLTPAQKTLADAKLRDLLANPRPPGLRFEKLKGQRRHKARDKERYTLHLDGNYKLSFSLEGSVAVLRNIGTHNEIDRAP